jgi:hypothetical protein
MSSGLSDIRYEMAQTDFVQPNSAIAYSDIALNAIIDVTA